MTTIFVTYNGDSIVKISALGHCDYAPEGSDIVCAGVSTLLQTIIIATKKMYNIDIIYSLQEGDLSMQIPSDKNIQTIVKAILCGLCDIESGYPKNLQIKEIRDVY